MAGVGENFRQDYRIYRIETSVMAGVGRMSLVAEGGPTSVYSAAGHDPGPGSATPSARDTYRCVFVHLLGY